ncbi:hypothetical protein C4D60_Mb07t14640 [Musa balbisiana]|uniref:Uncharacterized protein n=1 Tax=Musa balbisiana TaxID=52838 RepID=A0A4S8JH95_MUSBA|nr:hypothetical protein C4D60_Mb07t14640 [Musa balbisiana]
MDPEEGNGEKRALDGEDLVSNKKLRKNRFQVRVLQDAFYGAQHPSLRRRRSLQTRPGSPSNRCRRGLPVGGPTIAADLGRGNPRMRIPLIIQWKVRLSFLCLPPGW